jgi:hypothetical protein
VPKTLLPKPAGLLTFPAAQHLAALHQQEHATVFAMATPPPRKTSLSMDVLEPAVCAHLTGHQQCHALIPQGHVSHASALLIPRNKQIVQQVLRISLSPCMT